jgi:hypothetical protein
MVRREVKPVSLAGYARVTTVANASGNAGRWYRCWRISGRQVESGNPHRPTTSRGGGELVFCGHHANKFAPELVKIAVEVVAAPDFDWRGSDLTQNPGLLNG